MICLSHKTAMKFWLNCCKHPSSYKKESNDILNSCKAYIPEDLSIHIVETDKIHVLLSSQEKRRNHSSVYAHVLTQEIPNSCLYRASDDVVVCSPELALLQLAGEKSIPEIAKLACELTATFNLSQESNKLGESDTVCLRQGARIVERKPVVHLQDLNDFAAQLYQVRGKSKFCRAVKYVPSGSAASPMEICLALVLCLPSACGGFGLPKPEFNGGVLLSSKAATIYGHTKCSCDLLWRNKSVDVEYNSDAVHANSVQMLRDSERTLALRQDGYNVVGVTKAQLFDMQRVRQVAGQIAGMLGRRIRTQRKNFPMLQDQLYYQLGLRK